MEIKDNTIEQMKQAAAKTLSEEAKLESRIKELQEEIAMLKSNNEDNQSITAIQYYKEKKEKN